MTRPLPNWSSKVDELLVFSRIRLLAVDMDGTLISGGAALNKNIAGLRRRLGAANAQVRLVVATGRTYTGILPYLDALALPKRSPLILYNGSVIVEHVTGLVRRRATIPSGAFQEIRDIALSMNLVMLAYCLDHPGLEDFHLSSGRELVLSCSRSPGFSREFNLMPIQEMRGDDLLESSAVLVGDFESGAQKNQCLIDLNKIDDISVTSSGGGFIEIRPKGSNKAEALRQVADSLGISREEVAAIGDNDNDAEMLSWAGVGIAVSGASELALRNSSYVCAYGPVEGAIQALRLITHAMRYKLVLGNL